MSLALMLLAASPLFEQHVRPVLEKQCHGCHNAATHQGGLDLTSREKMLRGGDRGPAIVPGDPSSSLLYAYINHDRQPGMPLGGKKLPADTIARIGEWIKAGAKFEDSKEITSDHWSFQKAKQVAAPKTHANPVDGFLAIEQEKRGLKPLPGADKHTLLRRLYLDVIGIPPTPQQVAAFLADTSPHAYNKVVDELLASKHYGERWGRHWMDIWRYSDWYGSGNAEVRNSQRHIWQWRDWIVESLNEDKGYGRMIEEMLAGDEIAPNDPKTLRATGFLARNWFRFNRNVWLVDTIESTSTAFLGVTLKCARCHDHKYDPFPQEDYYRFRAFFEPHDIRIDRVAGQPDRKKAGLPRAYDSEPKPALPDVDGGINLMPQIFEKTYLFIRGDENDPDKSRAIEPGVPRVFGDAALKIKPIELSVDAWYPDLRGFVTTDLLAEAKANIAAVEDRLRKTREELDQALREKDIPQPEASGPPVDFAKDVKPIFEERCSSCHLGRNSKAGLSLGSAATIQAGGKGGPAVVAGKSAESLLIQSLRGSRQPKMPFNGPALAEAQIEVIARWIDQLPRRKPADIAKENPGLIAAIEKELAAARAAVPALEARLRAEQARYANPPSPDLESLAEAARKAEREYNLLKSEEQVFRAQLKMTEALAAPANVRDKAAAAAKRNLETALEALNKPTDAYSPIGPMHPKISTGRRLALARWIASRENPLTARVAVNHIWMRHFGAPLVPSVADFGKNGKSPTHPELLDWLAVDFMDHGWSMKRLHRLLLTSDAYKRQSGVASADHPNLKLDPNNTWLWRMNPRRLESEVIRDSVLAVSGSLDRTMGGPELHEESQQDTPRRSLYFRITPAAQMQFLKVFDGADPNACYRRAESIMPQQALALANSALSLEQAKVLAANLPTEHFIEHAFLAVLSRPPTPPEAEKSRAYLASIAAPERARQSLVHALMNRNEFVTIR